ncbi:hypothetical protein HY604_04590 [Candidatus Peregrinibacteria bacterium]|nr:hypothetical protein [Candidatus Peregrinibacteria bacterium]
MHTGYASNVTQTILELPDLVNNLLLLLSDKEKDVIKRRFSLNGVEKHTLEQIGKNFAVTRERVRQIEKNALSKMRRNVFNTSLRHLHDFTSSVVEENGGLMKEDNLVESVYKILPQNIKLDRNSLHLSFVLHEKIECIGNTINFHPYVRRKDLQDYALKSASNKLINQLHKYGNVKKIDRIHKDLEQDFSDILFDEKMMRALVSVDKRLALLDDDQVGLLEWRHVNPRTLRDKILYVLRSEKRPMHFTDIAKGISSLGFDSRPLNVQAVHNELIRHGQFVLIGRGIYALDEWGYESGTVLDVIEKLFKEKKEMSQDEIIEKVLKQRHVKKITIVLALKNDRKFERVGRKRYRLKA